VIDKSTYSWLWRPGYILLPALCIAFLPVISPAQTFNISTVYGTCTTSSPATTPPCTPGYGGDGGAATSSSVLFNGPSDLIFDSSGNLYISDCSNNRIREVTASNGNITTFAGDGDAGFAGDGAAPASSGTEINCPAGMVFGLGSFKSNFYFADNLNYEVREIANNIIDTVAGNEGKGAAFAGDLGSATQAQLWNPWGVAVDGSGNMYIGDAYNNVVRVVCVTQAPLPCSNTYFVGAGATWISGDITTFAGNNTTGAGYNGDGGPAPAALLNNPTAVILDPYGNLLITDTGNGAIRKVTPAGIISTLVGNGSGNAGYGGDGGLATGPDVLLNNPKGIALDPNGNLYIADTVNSVIRMVTADGYITTIAGNEGKGPGYAGDGGPATSAQLYEPTGVAYYNGKIYIADSGNNVIRLLTPVAQTPSINKGGVVNDADYSAAVAPGGIAAVFGDFDLTVPAGSTTVPLATSLANLSLDFGSTAAPLYYASGGQVNVQVPWDVSTSAPASLTATYNGATSSAQSVTIQQFAPAIFTTNAQGTGAGAILDSNYNLISSLNPATAGTTVILIYCTGLGPVTNQPATGSPALSNPLSQSTTPTVMIGGVPADVLFSGLAPGYVGLYQVNVQVPSGISSGSAVPLTISVGGETSNQVTINVQ